MKARKRFGQHFLEAPWAVRLVNAIAPRADETFLEIGPGRGAITRLLAERAARVVVVELDRDLAQELEAAAIPRVTVVQADFLSADIAALNLPHGTRVAGNLPYNVATPILFRLLESTRGRGTYRDATLMLQAEVVDRMTASPGGKTYGPLTVAVGVDALVTRLLTLPPGAFRPPPKVTSAVVRLEFPVPPPYPDLPDAFAPMIRSIFTMRRKTIGNALGPAAETAGVTAAAVLAAVGVDARRRPETLPVPTLIDLARALTAARDAR